MTSLPLISYEYAADWLPFWKGAGFFAATFVLEDAAAIGAGLLLASGGISWANAFLSCFLGIWAGDVGLYLLARWGGRKWVPQSWLDKYSAKISRAESWMGRHGYKVLVFSRCVPGARLPTYLAAGFLRLAWDRFALVTALASLVWTGFVLWLTLTIGNPLLHWLAAYKTAAITLLVGLLAAIVIRWLARKFASFSLSQGLTRWTKWEFWPGWLFYPPVVVYCVWLAIKHRGISLPTIANPGILAGGLVGESKFATLEDLRKSSPEFTATASLIPGGSVRQRLELLEKRLAELEITYPFILKPDLGQRGAGVKLIKHPAQAEQYLGTVVAPVVVQRYVAGPQEVGIFYFRHPGEAHGKIFAITEKLFPILTADGRLTIKEMILKDPRARILAAKYLARFKGRQDEIPAPGTPLRLVEAGNHAQGCIFRDGRHLWTAELEARIDEISQKLDGFFIGRFDIRYETDDALRRGTGFQIIELNGAAAEATNIYDDRNSVWTAYATLFEQWNLVFAIGTENRRRGCRTLSAMAVWRLWRNYAQVSKSYPAAD